MVKEYNRFGYILPGNSEKYSYQQIEKGMAALEREAL